MPVGIEDEDTAAESDDESESEEPNELLVQCEGNNFSGTGSSLPDRIQVIGNKEYRLGYANNIVKWAVFWFFTFCTSLIPYMIQQRDARIYKRKIRIGTEACSKKEEKKEGKNKKEKTN